MMTQKGSKQCSLVNITFIYTCDQLCWMVNFTNTLNLWV
jgi:hypothetical protein